MAAGWGNGRFQTRELFPAALNAGYESDRFLVAHPFARQLAFLDLMAKRPSAIEDRSRGCWRWRNPDSTPFRLFLGAPFYVRSRVGYGRVTVVTSTFPLAPLRTGLEPFSSSGSPANLGQFGVNLASMNVSVAWSAHDKGISVDGNHSFYPLRWFLCSTLPLLFQVF